MNPTVKLYYQLTSSGVVLCIIPETSTWMHCTISDFHRLKQAFEQWLTLIPLDNQVFELPSKEKFYRRDILSIDRVNEFFLSHTNGNERPNRDTLFRNPIVSLTNRCFLKCEYCYVSSPSFQQSEHRTLATDYVMRFIRRAYELANGRMFSVQFFGGEPTMHDHLPELVDYTRKLGLQVRISTNGVSGRLRSERYRDAVEDKQVEWRISLDAISEVENDRARGAGTFRAIMRNLDYLHERGANVSLKPVLTARTVRMFEDYLDFAYSRGFKVTYGTILPVGDAKKHGIKAEVTEHDVVEYIIDVFERKPYLIPTIELSPLGWMLKTLFLKNPMSLPRFTLYLHDDGFVYPMDGMISPEFKIGTADHVDIQKLETLQSKYGLDSARCKKCFLHGFCYTGDYQELRARDPSMMSDFDTCEDRRKSYTTFMTQPERFRNITLQMLQSTYTE